MYRKQILLAIPVVLASAQVMAFGGMFQGMLEQAAKDAATDIAKDTAKEMAHQNGIQGADALIDGAAAMSQNGTAQAINTGNSGIAAHMALESAIANNQMNTPIPAAQLQQYPAHIADLNRDGVVTYGEVHQLQQNNMPNRGYSANTQPADLNRDGIVTAQEISAYQAAVAQVSAQQHQQVAPQPAAQQQNSGGIGGLIGGFLPGGNNSAGQSGSGLFGGF